MCEHGVTQHTGRPMIWVQVVKDRERGPLHSWRGSQACHPGLHIPRMAAEMLLCSSHEERDAGLRDQGKSRSRRNASCSVGPPSAVPGNARLRSVRYLLDDGAKRLRKAAGLATGTKMNESFSLVWIEFQ